MFKPKSRNKAFPDLNLCGGELLAQYSLIHINVFRPLGLISSEDANAQFFFSQLPEIFAKADAYEGLSWHNHAIRSQDGEFFTFEDAFATADQGFVNPDVITMAGWKDVAALHQFAYRYDRHRDGMKELRNWGDRSVGATLAMWWAPKAERITIRKGWEKLQQLRAEGPSREVFTLQERFEAPEAG